MTHLYGHVGQTLFISTPPFSLLSCLYPSEEDDYFMRFARLDSKGDEEQNVPAFIT
jgi:hypothetical protein